MPRTLSYTDEALADLQAAETWLRQHGSGPAAWAKFDAIVSAIEGTFNTEIPNSRKSTLNMHHKTDWLTSRPPNLLAKAYMSVSEAAWNRGDALEVVAISDRLGRQILGVDIWLPTNPGHTIPGRFIYD